LTLRPLKSRQHAQRTTPCPKLTTTDGASAVAAPIARKLAVLTKREIVLNMGMGKYLCGIMIPQTSANR
jgi:hypothetical protein